MPNFIIKIELFGARAGEYERLRYAMGEEGFIRKYWENAAGERHWSDTEYFISGDFTTNSVMDQVYEIASKILPNPFVSVSQEMLQVNAERWGEVGNTLILKEPWGSQ